MTEETKQFIKIHTACKDCVFSQYEGNTQIGCSLNKLEKYKNIGYEIIEVYDDEKEFYVIDGRKCQFYRNSDWLCKIDALNPNININEIIQKETQISPDILILVHKNNTFEDVKTTLVSIQNSTILPLSIIIVFEQGKEKWIPEYFEWIKNNIKIPYSYEYMFSDNNMINAGIRRTKLFYICLEAGYPINPQYIEKINSKINNEMWPILYIASEFHYHHMFVNKSFHNFVGGFGKKTIEEKVQELKKEDECLKNTLITYETIWT